MSPVQPFTNLTQPLEWPTNQTPQPKPQDPRFQTLLINILTIILAAASVVVATLHFRHQRHNRTDAHERGEPMIVYCLVINRSLTEEQMKNTHWKQLAIHVVVIVMTQIPPTLS